MLESLCGMSGTFMAASFCFFFVGLGLMVSSPNGEQRVNLGLLVGSGGLLACVALMGASVLACWGSSG